MIELRQRMFVRKQSDATLVEYMVNMCIAPVLFRQPRAKDEVEKLEQKEFDKVGNEFDEQLSTHVRTTYENVQDVQSQLNCVQDEFKEHLRAMNKFMESHAEERRSALEKQQDTLNSLAALQESILATETKRAKEYNELTREVKETRSQKSPKNKKRSAMDIEYNECRRRSESSQDLIGCSLDDDGR